MRDAVCRGLHTQCLHNACTATTSRQKAPDRRNQLEVSRQKAPDRRHQTEGTKWGWDEGQSVGGQC